MKVLEDEILNLVVDSDREHTEKLTQTEVNSPQEATIEGAAYEVGKWLNERPNRPIDLRHVAMLVHYAKTHTEVQARKLNHSLYSTIE